MKNIHVKNKLNLVIYTIGYNGQGESIIILVKVDGAVHQSFLIDFYNKSNIDIVEFIMKEQAIDCFSNIIWTHPHQDHTMGLKDFMCKHDSEKTSFFYPVYLTTQDWSSRTKEQRWIIENIKNYQKGISCDHEWLMNFRPITNNYVMERCNYSTINGRKYFAAETLSPDSATLESKTLKKDEDSINDYSITLHIRFDGISVLLASDAYNKSIQKVDEHMRPNKIHYLKIPHHGSSKSLSILDWISDEELINFSVTTQYSSSGLPEESSLKLYKSKSKKLAVIKKMDSKFPYGYTKTNIDIIDKIEDHNCVGDVIYYGN